MKTMELPEPNTTEALLLLVLEERQLVTPEDVDGNLPVLTQAVDRLERLGWPIRQFPREQDSTGTRMGPITFGISREDRRHDERQAFVARLQTRGYRDWKSETLAVIAGQPLAPKPTAKPDADRPFTERCFTRLPGSRLSIPPIGEIEFRLLFGLMHIDRVEPTAVAIQPMRFVAVAHALKKSGWPIIIEGSPLGVCWSSEVSRDVIASWRATFGDSGVREAKAGKFE